VVITQAGTDPKVKSLVYVAAYAPDKGQSLADITSKYPQLESRKEYMKDDDGFLRISDQGIKKYFAADLDPESKAVVAATQGPFHVSCLTAQVSEAAWREKPTFMVVATKDQIIPPQLEADQAKAANAKAIEIPSSHVAMLSHPKEVSELIIEASK
jgi:pimeloyl-ACP methyl ester carboxylesterase